MPTRNKDAARDIYREWYRKNIADQREKSRAYRAENRDYIRQRQRLSNARRAEAIPNPRRARWTPEEDAFLMEDDGRSLFEKAVILNRAYPATIRRSSEVQNPRPKWVPEARKCKHCDTPYVPTTRQQKYCGKRCSLRVGGLAYRSRERAKWTPSPKFWTPEQIAILHRDDLTLREISQVTGRSYEAVKLKRQRLFRLR